MKEDLLLYGNINTTIPSLVDDTLKFNENMKKTIVSKRFYSSKINLSVSIVDKLCDCHTVSKLPQTSTLLVVYMMILIYLK